MGTGRTRNTRSVVRKKKRSRQERTGNVLCFDIETEPFTEEFEKAKTNAARLKYAPRFRLACVYSENTGSYRFFTEDNASDLVQLLQSADTLVSFNGLAFDELVLRKYCGLVGRMPLAGTHVDLCAIVLTLLGRRVKLDTLSLMNLKERKHTKGREMASLDLKGLQTACRSDVSQTYRLYKLYLKNKLDLPPGRRKRLRDTADDIVTRLLAIEPIGDRYAVLGDDGTIEPMTDGQLSDYLAGLR